MDNNLKQARVLAKFLTNGIRGAQHGVSKLPGWAQLGIGGVGIAPAAWMLTKENQAERSAMLTSKPKTTGLKHPQKLKPQPSSEIRTDAV
jgi:hypothetical protein